MSREVRRVPLDWEHPKSTDVPWSRGEPVAIPLYDHHRYKDHLADYATDQDDHDEDPPAPEDYMPDFSGVPEEQLGWCMYETVSEGTPISPVLSTPEELAHWLADNNASASGSMTATYEQWLATVRSGWAPSLSFSTSTGLISGVAATTLFQKEQ